MAIKQQGAVGVEKPLVSVIVPVYNIEKYLDRCVKSILEQTYQNLEILLIDDGSTDQSAIMCDEYAVWDERVRVIHQKNGGLAAARNTALDNIAGEFVTCVDGDDFISPYYIENMYSALSSADADIACCQYLDYYDGNKLPKYARVKIEQVEAFDREGFFRKMLYQDGADVSACAKLYRSECFEGVRFPKGKLYEDVATTYLAIERAEKIAVIPNNDYLYYQRNNSIARGSFKLEKMDAIVHMNQLKEYMSERYPSLEKAAVCRYFSAVCNILFLIQENEFFEEKCFLWSEVKRYRKNVFWDREGRKKARIAAGLSYFGYSVLKNVYSIVG